VSGPDRYTTLMLSLPYLGKLFGAKQTPLSRLKLERRLGMLEEQDAELLREIEGVIQWSHQPMDRTDPAMAAAAQRLLERLPSPVLQEIVCFRLEMRTLVAALRRRQAGQAAPRPMPAWGFGRWLGHIQRYWAEPGFRLEGVFAWVRDANRLLREADSLGLERLLLETVWGRLGRFAEGHYFDFEAVVLYVLRWNIINRWTTYDGEVAVRRFIELADGGVGEFAAMFEGGVTA